MDTKIATVPGRLGGGPAQTNVVCHFWKVGKCNRNPCRFMHRESPPPKVYHRTPKQTSVSLVERPKRSFSYSLNDSADFSGGSEEKRAQKISNHVIEDPPRKRFNSKNPLGSTTRVGGSEYRCSRESPTSRTEEVNMKTITVCRKCPENPSPSKSGGDVAEGKTIKKSSKKSCEHWMSGTCVEGDGCQFLHSWSDGNWFSMLTKLQGHSQAVSGIALPSGSDKLYSGSNDGTVHVWDCHTGQSTKVINLGARIGTLISEGPWIFVGLPNCVKAWNLETGAEFSLDEPVGQVFAMDVAVDMLFAGAQDGSILAWKGSTENPMAPFQLAKSLKGHTGTVTCVTVGDKRLYSGSMDNTIRVWDLSTLQCIHTLNGHTDAVMSLICWEEYLLSCSLDQTIKVWAATEEGNLEVIYTHNEEHGAIALCGIYDTEAKPILLCSCNDNSVRLYDLPSFNDRGRIFSKREIGTLHVGPYGLFFSGDRTGMLNVWKLVESHKGVSQIA
ncbi:hypothetical protein JCGZ_19808 [Jatropha curcas]|uniref:C3H1-type domain-containing protein n=1 Tax=Jatropha curcas TaxID=180498 RepID=A0A067JU76_JATCU|nr:zinc finger CCCH domain-containing protein 48 [Jatropha curcas]XP_037493040.1 zinc finger CCCH domain-containing protein 48 [Jatropha curcas]KDP27447.1 hypothetical protein JCGZ_19808 [Jatropha curcas]